MSEIRSGFAALIGRPNAGKSTLINAVVGSKVAITSDTPQTTRHRLRAVLDREDAQVVLVDTPGLHKPQDALGEELNRSALQGMKDVDVVCLVIDASQVVGRGDERIAKQISSSKAHKLLVVTKADLVDQAAAELQIKRAAKFLEFDAQVVVSATEGFNIEGFVDAVVSMLPDGPRYFPRDMPTDQPIEVMIAEFIREKALRKTHDEVPHAVGVAIEDMHHDDRNDVTTVMAVLYVERDSQKGILIGKGGEMIRAIGSEARADLERLVGNKVYLDLKVKVKRDWRRDASQIRRFGYGEGL